MQIQQAKGDFNRPRWELKSKGQPHPMRRWCHTATTYGSNLYIIGGRLPESAKSKEFVYKVNFQNLQCEQLQLSDNSMLRQSHSCSLINDSIYVLFGIGKNSNVRKIQICFKRSDLFSILKDCIQLKIGQNTLVPQKKQQKSEINPRQSHMSIVIENRFILIYGGVDSEQKLLQDFYLYDIERQTWKKIQKITGRIEVKVGGSLINIKNQIYLFGGEINDQNEYSNQLYKIQILNYQDNQKQLQPEIIIRNLKVHGKKPLPRSQFASVVYKDRYLIVLGGQGPKKQKSEFPTLLSDVWAFDAQKNLWEEIVPQNSSIFKPRSSFTATVYKQSLFVFGGLVSFKDFRSTDDFFVLNLNRQIQKRPICTLCKNSYKPPVNQQLQIQKSTAKLNSPNFQTGYSTIFAISQMIQDPFIAIGTLLHSFNPFNIQKCSIILDCHSLSFKIKKLLFNENQWRTILTDYKFQPLIQQQDYRIKNALRHQIYRNQINYLSYNLKNCCFRLGNQILLSWINTKNELQLCLLNKYGIFYSQNLINNVSRQTFTSHTPIILQYLKENSIDLNKLCENSFNIIITSLKKSEYENQIYYSQDMKDIILGQNYTQLKDFLNTYFINKLSYDIYISNIAKDTYQNDQLYVHLQSSIDQIQKWPQENQYPQLFENVYTYNSKQKNSVSLIYQNGKLMHKKVLNAKEHTQTVYQFHLTKRILPNLTFSDVQPTQQLINAIKVVIKSLNNSYPVPLKRQKSIERQIVQSNFNTPQKQQNQDSNKGKKAVKTNQPQNGENYMQIQIGMRQEGQI